MRADRWMALLGVACVAYAGASHLLMTYAPTAPWAIVVLLGPVLAMLLKLAVGSRSVTGMLLAGSSVLATLGVAWTGGVGDVALLYVLQHAGIHLALGIGFAATLRAGRLSMIGSIAERVHGQLTPAMVQYTRALTLWWTLYFVAMALSSWWVYRSCAWATWSLLANLVTPGLIAALFVGEYLLRYRLHPEFERASLTDAIRAWGQPAAARPAAGK